MSILEALKEVKAEVPELKSFFYADLNEVNANEADSLVKSEYPIIIVMPINPVDTIGKSGITKTSFELTAFVLSPSTASTMDYRSEDVETEVIFPMRQIARRFMHKLNEHSIIDPETPGIQTVNYQPSYSSMDANLFGVSVRATIPVIESASVCV